MSGPVVIEDYVLRAGIGGVSPPPLSDYIDLGSRSIAGVFIPAGWDETQMDFLIDLGPGGQGTILSVDFTGLADTIYTFSRAESTTMAMASRVALFPSTADGSDLLFKLITLFNLTD